LIYTNFFIQSEESLTSSLFAYSSWLFGWFLNIFIYIFFLSFLLSFFYSKMFIYSLSRLNLSTCYIERDIAEALATLLGYNSLSITLIQIFLVKSHKCVRFNPNWSNFERIIDLNILQLSIEIITRVVIYFYKVFGAVLSIVNFNLAIIRKKRTDTKMVWRLIFFFLVWLICLYLMLAICITIPVNSVECSFSFATTFYLIKLYFASI